MSTCEYDLFGYISNFNVISTALSSSLSLSTSPPLKKVIHDLNELSLDLRKEFGFVEDNVVSYILAIHTCILKSEGGNER